MTRNESQQPVNKFAFDPNWYRREMIKIWRRMIPVLEQRLRTHDYPPNGGRAKLERQIATGKQCLARYERIEERLANGEQLPHHKLV